MNDSKPSFFDAPHGTRIAYFATPGKSPTVMFFGGLKSDMTGTKALHLENHCKKKGYSFLRFDYGGHGLSSGKFEDGTIGSWHEDALAAIDNLTEGPLVLVGSSMGGWQVLLAALARKQRVKALIGLAPAPDFSEWLLWKKMSQKDKDIVRETGKITYPSDYGDPYTFTKALFEDGRKRLLLDKPIELDCPLRLIHGMQDSEVPYKVSLKILERLTGGDAELALVKGADHRLSTQRDLARLTATVDGLIERINNVN